MLDPSVVGSYKEQDLKVVSIIEEGDVEKEYSSGIDYNEIEVYNDSPNGYYFQLQIPTNTDDPQTYVKRYPKKTYVYLSTTDVDTITYNFTPPEYIADSIFYNKKLVWLLADSPTDGRWQPITIVKQ